MIASGGCGKSAHYKKRPPLSRWLNDRKFCYTHKDYLGLILDSTRLANPKVHAEVRWPRKNRKKIVAKLLENNALVVNDDIHNGVSLTAMAA